MPPVPGKIYSGKGTKISSIKYFYLLISALKDAGILKRYFDSAPQPILTFSEDAILYASWINDKNWDYHHERVLSNILPSKNIFIDFWMILLLEKCEPSQTMIFGPRFFIQLSPSVFRSESPLLFEFGIDFGMVNQWRIEVFYDMVWQF